MGSRARGFSLLEMGIAGAILLILTAIMLPNYLSYKSRLLLDSWVRQVAGDLDRQRERTIALEQDCGLLILTDQEYELVENGVSVVPRMVRNLRGFPQGGVRFANISPGTRVEFTPESLRTRGGELTGNWAFARPKGASSITVQLSVGDVTRSVIITADGRVDAQ